MGEFKGLICSNSESISTELFGGADFTPFCLLSEREKSNWDLKEIYLLLLRDIRDVEEWPNSLLVLQLMKASKVWYQENELETRK